MPATTTPTYNKLLKALATTFFVWAALTVAGLPGGWKWLVPGGLAAWVLSEIF